MFHSVFLTLHASSIIMNTFLLSCKKKIHRLKANGLGQMQWTSVEFCSILGQIEHEHVV